MKKEYIKPTTRAFKIQAQTILAASNVRMRVQGTSDEFYYNNEEGDGSDAW
jgi:hypothetical protein